MSALKSSVGGGLAVPQVLQDLILEGSVHVQKSECPSSSSLVPVRACAVVSSVKSDEMIL